MDLKVKFNLILHKRDSTRINWFWRLYIKGQKYTNTNKKKAEIIIVLPDKVVFRPKKALNKTKNSILETLCNKHTNY